MRNLIKVTGFIAVAVTTLVAVAMPAYAGTIPESQQVIVRPADIRPIAESLSGDAGWYRTVVGDAFVEPTNDVAYNNNGSLKFTVGEGSGSYTELGLYSHLPSHRLADLGSINGLSYATWQTQDAPQAVSLQVGVDMDVTDTFKEWQGRLIFEPYMGNIDTEENTISHDKWQTWITTKSNSVWWMTWSDEATAHYERENPCPQSAPCTTAEIYELFPDVGFNAAYGNPLVLKAGSGWTNFVGYADAPRVGGLTNTYWDFEPAAPIAASKEACKNNGWTTLADSDGAPYQNQGHCVSSASATR